MSKRKKENVSDIVEKYQKMYPNTERKAIKKLIHSKYLDLNIRTLDRHLQKAFKKQRQNETASAKREVPPSVIKSGIPVRGGWDPSPRLNFFVTQERPPITVQLPTVAFNIET